MSFDENKINREADGKFGTKEGWPPDPSVTLSAQTPVVEFEDKYELITNEYGDHKTFHEYADAVAAAGGDEKRVWTITEDGIPDDELVYKFTYNDDEEIVSGTSEFEAQDRAAELFNERYGDGEQIEAEDLDDYEVHRGDMENIFDEDAWEPVSTLGIHAGFHYVNRMDYVVSTEPWSDESENFAW